MHPKTIGSVLFSELVSKDVHMYKSDTLLRQVVLVFAAAGRSDTDNLLISGFGNTLADSVAYEMAGISRQDIYMIDKKSQLHES
jgi:phosphatidate phosphatase PAH1